MSDCQSYRWTAGRSSLGSSRKLVSNERCDCSYCPPVIAETERPHGALAPHPQRRVRPGAGGVRRGARFEPPAATLGENLQLCEATPVSGLPQPRGIREAMQTIRPKSKVSLIYWTRTPLFL